MTKNDLIEKYENKYKSFNDLLIKERCKPNQISENINFIYAEFIKDLHSLDENPSTGG